MERLVAFRLHRQLHAALVAEAKARGVSLSRVIRDRISRPADHGVMPAEGRRAA
jgi:hypothetical protein